MIIASRNLLNKLLHPLRNIKIWPLMVIFIILGGLSVVELKNNSETMGELKQQVIAADQEGENTAEALSELANYVFNHMNTSTSVELQGAYQRAYDAILEDSVGTAGGNSSLYDEARTYCEGQGYRLLTQRAECVRKYIDQRTTDDTNPDLPEPPNQQLYKFNFAAPIWSSDLAGWSLLGAAIAALLIFGKLAHKLLIKNYRP